MSETKNELQEILAHSIDECRKKFASEDDFLFWLKANFTINTQSDELLDIFEAVISTSTWGNSKSGGPVWIMDFRCENIFKIMPKSPWLPYFIQSKVLKNLSLWFLEKANTFITTTGISNVLVAVCGEKEKFYFYSTANFCELLSNLLKQGTVFQFNDTEKSYLTYSESKKIDEGNYLSYLAFEGEQKKFFPNNESSRIWDKNFSPHLCIRGHWRYPLCQPESLHYLISPDDRKKYYLWGSKIFVKPVHGIENFLPMVVANIMEVTIRGAEYPYPQIRYTETLKLHKEVPVYRNWFVDISSKSAPCYLWTQTRDEVELMGRVLKLQMPKINDTYAWHRDYPLKIQWDVIDAYDILG